MKLEKGMLISNGLWWFILVEVWYSSNQKETHLHCICDNANNIYSFKPEEIEHYLSLKEIYDVGYGIKKDLPEHLSNRKIPYNVITEVLSGGEDDRFSHWKGEE